MRRVKFFKVYSKSVEDFDGYNSGNLNVIGDGISDWLEIDSPNIHKVFSELCKDHNTHDLNGVKSSIIMIEDHRLTMADVKITLDKVKAAENKYVAAEAAKKLKAVLKKKGKVAQTLAEKKKLLASLKAELGD